MDMLTLLGQRVPEPIQRFWSGFAAQWDSDPAERFYEVFHFDDHESSANELGQLVIEGTKQATATLLWSFEIEDKPIPQPGYLSVVTNWHGEPLCVIETTRLDVVPFNEVTAEFAAIEGEGDGSLRHWREVHSHYFARECARLGREFAPDMPVVCEQFKVVYGKMAPPDPPQRASEKT